MTESEFTIFAKRLFVSFPDVWEWLNANSPDPQETQRVWRSVLSAYSLEECLLVLDAWLTGAKPIYKAYERAHIAILIRQCVQFDREKNRQRTTTGNAADDYRKTRRKDYKPLALNIPELGMIFREGVAMRKKWLDGEITEAEWQERKQRLLEKVQ